MRPIGATLLLVTVAFVPHLTLARSPKTAKELAPESFEASLKRARLAVKRAHWNEAGNEYLHCLSLRPEKHFALAVKAAAAFRWAGEEEGYEKVLALVESLPLEPGKVGEADRASRIILLRPGPIEPRFENVIRHFRQHADLTDPSKTRYLLLEALIAHRLGNPEEVLRTLEKLEDQKLASALEANALCLKAAASLALDKNGADRTTIDSLTERLDALLRAPEEKNWQDWLIAHLFHRETARAFLRKQGSPAMLPPSGTRFDCHYQVEYESSIASQAEGTDLGVQKADSRSTGEFTVEVLETVDGRIGKIAFLARKLDSTETLSGGPGGHLPEPRKNDESKKILGKPFTATAVGRVVELRDHRGEPVPAETAILVPVPVASFLTASGLHHPLGKELQSRLFDPGQGFADFLPWRHLDAPGDSVPVMRGGASELIKPGNGWEISSVKKAQLGFVERKKVDDVDCVLLELTIDASGPHREIYGGMPTRSTITLAARILIEQRTGWIREFDLQRNVTAESEGTFQEIPMKMKTQETTRVSASITAHRP